MYRSIFPWAVALFVIVPGASPALAGDAELARFNAEAESAWQRLYKKQADLNQINLVQTTSGTRAGVAFDETLTVEVIRKEDKFVMSRVIDGRPTDKLPPSTRAIAEADVIYGASGSYYFQIMDKDRKAEWSIVKVDEAELNGVQHVPDIRHGMVNLPSSGIPVTALGPSAQHARAVKAETVEHQGKSCIAVEFAVNEDESGIYHCDDVFQKPDFDMRPFKKCRVVFSPEQNWLPLHGDFQIQDRGRTMEFAVDWVFQPIGTAIDEVVLSKESVTMSTDGATVAVTSDFRRQQADEADNRFTLSHYGLPEPTLGTTSNSVWYFLLASVLMIAGGIGLRRMSKPRASGKVSARMQPT
ncbi:MAG: hypothetical protein KDB14_04450 [Planctomycetales bacterium]|nr:hypothetical protein [Planctomycetales bacterium]